MANIDVYKQYFEADCFFNNVERKGVVVWLNAESDCGTIRYEVGVSFFPHRDAEDFAVSYDACVQKELVNTKGRRSKKRDAEYLAQVQTVATTLAESLNATIFWDKPLNQAQYG
jgi:hypothetical protein